MTWLIPALLLFVAILVIAMWTRRKIRAVAKRDYCKLTCQGGSECGRCPCLHPKQCEMGNWKAVK